MHKQLASTLRSRQLGDELRRAARRKRLTGTQVALRTDFSTSKVSRMFSGKRGTHPIDVALLLGLLDVPTGDRERLIGLAEDDANEGWWQKHRDYPPSESATLSYLTRTARRIECYGASRLPLLRTTAYTPNRSTLVTFFVEEQALAVPRDLLDHLLKSADQPETCLRVVPRAAALDVGDSAFELVVDQEGNHVVRVDLLNSTVFLEGPDTGSYRSALGRLRAAALDRDESADLIREIRDGVEP